MQGQRFLAATVSASVTSTACAGVMMALVLEAAWEGQARLAPTGFNTSRSSLSVSALTS
jgi:hypothetical protein